jgi:hypothetical protein
MLDIFIYWILPIGAFVGVSIFISEYIFRHEKDE